MGRYRWWRSVGALVAMIAVVLPAGVVAATAVDPKPATLDARVGAAGLSHEGVAEDRRLSPTTVVTAVAPAPVAILPPAVPSTTVPARSSSATVPPAPSTVTTTSTVVPPTTSPPTTKAPLPAQSSWSNVQRGVTANMRMEPEVPVAGEPVRFVIDVSAPPGCCIVHLSYGDGGETAGGGNCENPTKPGVTYFHTYASAGAYQARLIIATFPCRGPDGQPPVPAIYGTSIDACIGVGPAGQAGCRP